MDHLLNQVDKNVSSSELLDIFGTSAKDTESLIPKKNEKLKVIRNEDLPENEEGQPRADATGQHLLKAEQVRDQPKAEPDKRRPERPCEGQGVEPGLRPTLQPGDPVCDRCGVYGVSQSGMRSRAIISSNVGRRRIAS